MKTISITVSGKVQGVFYRQNTKEKADELGIKGLVKNLPDETVYIIATGTEQQLEKLREWCRVGSRRSVVTGIDVKELPLQEFRSFIIERY